MANIQMYIEMRRRRATVTLPQYYLNKYGLKDAVQSAKLLGIFQSTDADWSGPVCVCELQDGHIVELITECVQLDPITDEAF